MDAHMARLAATVAGGPTIERVAAAHVGEAAGAACTAAAAVDEAAAAPGVAVDHTSTAAADDPPVAVGLTAAVMDEERVAVVIAADDRPLPALRLGVASSSSSSSGVLHAVRREGRSHVVDIADAGERQVEGVVVRRGVRRASIPGSSAGLSSTLWLRTAGVIFTLVLSSSAQHRSNTKQAPRPPP